MAELFASGRIIDLILLLMLVEYVGLWLYLGRSVTELGLLGYLLSGVFLLLALRVALVGGGWIWIALFLAAALIVHCLDLRRRLTQ